MDFLEELRQRARYHRQKADIYEAALRTAEQDEQVLGAKGKTASPPAENPTAEGFGGFSTRREYIRDLIQRKAGLKPSEMRAIAEQEGVTLNKSFPYVQLAKLVEDREAKAAGGKYYPNVSAAVGD